MGDRGRHGIRWWWRACEGWSWPVYLRGSEGEERQRHFAHAGIAAIRALLADCAFAKGVGLLDEFEDCLVAVLEIQLKFSDGIFKIQEKSFPIE